MPAAGLALDPAGFERACLGIVTGEKACIDVNGAYAPSDTQPDDDPVAAGLAAPRPRLPTIHDLATVALATRPETGGRFVEQILLLPEGLVAHSHGRSAEMAVGEIGFARSAVHRDGVLQHLSRVFHRESKARTGGRSRPTPRSSACLLQHEPTMAFPSGPRKSHRNSSPTDGRDNQYHAPPQAVFG